MDALLGILATTAIALVATVVLLIATLGAVIGFAVALVVMPWLMPILRFVLRRPTRRERATRVDGPRRSPAAPGGYTWTTPGRASAGVR